MGKSIGQEFSDRQVAFDEADLSFRMAPGTTLDDNDKDTIQTPNGTTVNLRLRPEALTVEFNPPLVIHVKHWYADDAKLRSVRYDFPPPGGSAKGQIGDIQVWRSEDTHGIFSPLDEIKKSIQDSFDDFRAGTRLDRAGYRPLDDPDPEGLLKEFERKFAASSKPTSGKFSAASINAFNVSITIKSTVEIAKRQGKAGIRVVPWKPVTVRGTTAQNGAEIERWFKEEKVDLVPLDAIYVESPDGIMVQYDFGKGKGFEDIVALNRIKVVRGPALTLEQFTLLNRVREWADTEQGVITLFVLGLAFFDAARQTDNAGLAGLAALQRTAEANPQARIVPGLTRDTIERTLNEGARQALQQFVCDNYEAIKAALPAFSFKEIFGQSVTNCGGR